MILVAFTVGAGICIVAAIIAFLFGAAPWLILSAGIIAGILAAGITLAILLPMERKKQREKSAVAALKQEYIVEKKNELPSEELVEEDIPLPSVELPKAVTFQSKTPEQLEEERLQKSIAGMEHQSLELGWQLDALQAQQPREE